MMDNIIIIYILGWGFTIFWYLLSDKEPEDLNIARFVFWPFFAARGLWRSLKLALKE